MYFEMCYTIDIFTYSYTIYAKLIIQYAMLYIYIYINNFCI